MTVFQGGAPVDLDREGLRARMRETRVDVLVELAEGAERAVAWGCDLSYDYVKINADYTSLIVQQPDGMIAKEDKVASYSPTFKRMLLAEALKYIAAFSGQIAVIKYGGAAMVKDSLKEAFAEDVSLLKKVGLKPVVVHGGAPEITKTLEKLGERSEFVDGMRITDAQSLPIVEMVLSGKVNQELVALLNARNAGAVGLSTLPKDRNSGDSQFYILLAKSRFLDGNYTVFGQVVAGNDVLNKIQKGDLVVRASIIQG